MFSAKSSARIKLLIVTPYRNLVRGLQWGRSAPSFTLVELLIVIGILAVLVASVVMVLNPTQLLAQARDAKRLADATALNKALGILQVLQPPISFGTAPTVYVSLPDTSPTCTNLGLPALPSGWVYSCVSSSSLQNANGTGWIPVNFAITGGALLPTLPLDPTNATSNNNFYAYTSQGTGIWEISAPLESTKYQGSVGSSDGGTNVVRYEGGTSVGILAQTPFGSPSGPPTAQTNAATNVGLTGATINGSVNPQNASTTYWFEWGSTSGLGLTTAQQVITSGNASTSVSANLSSLTSLTVYYYRLDAQNQYGSTQGQISTFVTSGGHASM